MFNIGMRNYLHNLHTKYVVLNKYRSHKFIKIKFLLYGYISFLLHLCYFMTFDCLERCCARYIAQTRPIRFTTRTRN